MKQAHTRPLRRFEPLSRLGDYRVERHHVDPRGWNVLSSDGRTVGEVKDLVVDTERMRARYLDVELDAAGWDLRSDPHILVPVEHARRDGTHHRLIVDDLSASRVEGLIEARDRHNETFWERWWAGDTEAVRPQAAPAAHDNLRRALEDVRPGEQVRIPVVDEEIVVERRPVTRDR